MIASFRYTRLHCANYTLGARGGGRLLWRLVAADGCGGDDMSRRPRCRHQRHSMSRDLLATSQLGLGRSLPCWRRMRVRDGLSGWRARRPISDCAVLPAPALRRSANHVASRGQNGASRSSGFGCWCSRLETGSGERCAGLRELVIKMDATRCDGIRAIVFRQIADAAVLANQPLRQSEMAVFFLFFGSTILASKSGSWYGVALARGFAAGPSGARGFNE